MLNIILNISLFIVLLRSAHTQQYLNDSCVFQNGKLGRCARFENCPSAIELVRNKRGTPENCGFDGRHPIVCCEINIQSRRRKAGEISKEKCKEMYYIPPERRAKPNLIPLLPPVTTTSSSRIPLIPTPAELQVIDYADDSNNQDTEVVGGIEASPMEFPHMAALGYEEENQIKWACGGSLISDKFVLTAAHCIHTQIGTVKHVRLGDLNLNSARDIAKPQNFDVLRTFVHPKYRAPSVYNDIAIIELSSNAIIDDYVQPGCLFAEVEIPTRVLSATGWGLTRFQGKPAEHLQDVRLREFPFEVCRDAYKSTSKRRLATGIDKVTHICAGEDGKDTCQGDSGGPLQIKNTEFSRGYSVVGVTSFGKACGIGNSIAVYTRVSPYIEWIESIVWPEY